MTDDEIRGWQISINSNPVGTDISKVEPVAYKFLDQYRELIMQYKGGYKTKEECQSIGKLLRKEYEENMQAVGRYTEDCIKGYQSDAGRRCVRKNNIKAIRH